MDNSIINAIIAGIGISLLAGPLGCFVIYRKMSYFGDSLSHSALLGVTLGLILGINTNIGVVLVAFSFALILTYLQQKEVFSTDTLLGILAHGSLAIAMLGVAIIGYEDFELHDYLFGDILNISLNQIYWIILVLIISYILLYKNWKSLILATIDKNLAKASGISNFRMQLILTFLLTLTVASAVNIVGILLITSILIIPAASARHLSSSPEKMALNASLIAIISTISGITLAKSQNLPAGPSIVFIATAIFIAQMGLARLCRK